MRGPAGPLADVPVKVVGGKGIAGPDQKTGVTPRFVH
jgi:hypothetical protein